MKQEGGGKGKRKHGNGGGEVAAAAGTTIRGGDVTELDVYTLNVTMKLVPKLYEDLTWHRFITIKVLKLT